jgi:hypothetical protein
MRLAISFAAKAAGGDSTMTATLPCRMKSGSPLADDRIVPRGYVAIKETDKTHTYHVAAISYL